MSTTPASSEAQTTKPDAIVPEDPKTPLAQTMHALSTAVGETPQLVRAEVLELVDRLSKMLLDSCAHTRRPCT